MDHSDVKYVEASDGAAEEKSNEMDEMREETKVLKRKVAEQNLGAQREALLAEAERGAGGGRRGEAAVSGPASSIVPAPGQGAQSGTSQMSRSRSQLG